MHFSCTIAKKFKTYVAHLFPPQVLNTAPPQIKNPIERVSTIYKIDNESVILYLDKTRLVTWKRCAIKEFQGFEAIFFVDLINIFTGSPSWNRQHHSQTIYSTENLISMNLFKILCVVTWA